MGLVEMSVTGKFAEAALAKTRSLTSADERLGRRLSGYAQAAVGRAKGRAMVQLQEPNRPDHRRSELTKGAVHYVDSITVQAPKTGIGGELVVEITSTSPIAHILENGAAPHIIDTPGFPKGTLAEPEKGTWNVNWEGGSYASSYKIWNSKERRALRADSDGYYGDAHAPTGDLVVSHPGHPGYHFMRQGIEWAFGEGTPIHQNLLFDDE